MQKLLALTKRQINFRSFHSTKLFEIQSKYWNLNKHDSSYTNALQEIYDLTFPLKSYQPMSPTFTNKYMYYKAVQIFMLNLSAVHLIFPNGVSSCEGPGFSFRYRFDYPSEQKFNVYKDFMQLHKPNNIELVFDDKKCMTCDVPEDQYKWYELYGYLWK